MEKIEYTSRDSFELYKGKEPKITEYSAVDRAIEEIYRKQMEKQKEQEDSWCVIS